MGEICPRRGAPWRCSLAETKGKGREIIAFIISSTRERKPMATERHSLKEDIKSFSWLVFQKLQLQYFLARDA